MPGVAMNAIDGRIVPDSLPNREDMPANGSPKARLRGRRNGAHHRRQSSVDLHFNDVCDTDTSGSGSPLPHGSVSEGEGARSREMKAAEVPKLESGKKGSDSRSSRTTKTTMSSKKVSKPPLLLPVWDSSTKSGARKSVMPPDKGALKEKKPNQDVGSAKNGLKSPKGVEDTLEPELENPDLGPYLLKHARDLISSGENPRRALQYALRAAKSIEKCAGGKPSLDLVMCFHVIAAIQTSLGQYDEAVSVLERSIEIPILENGNDHALAKFSGYMQLGDTYTMLGQLENSIQCYASGLEVQKNALGDRDPRVGETCRYLAEAYMQTMQLDEAEKLCQIALEIHREQFAPGSPEETADRRLLGLICDTKGEYESALEHLVLASMAMVSSGHEAEAASVDCNIGDTYLALARYDEAAFAYQKALTIFKSTKGENHPSVASVFVRLADLYNKTGKFRESKAYCENALRIYQTPIAGTSSEEIASGFTDISAIYESMEEPENALKLLQKALKMYDNAPGQQSTIAGIEAQMGVLYYFTENYVESYNSFKNAITKLRSCGEKKSAFFGIALNQMGLACVQLYKINEAADLFEEARVILEEQYGPYHPDTIGTYSNLAGTYDAMGRLDKAIEILEHIVGLREEKLGTANSDVDEEKRRLSVLLREAGRIRHRKSRSLEMLLDVNTYVTKKGVVLRV